MVADSNADGKWSENKLVTVECLRGRLLAERANSRVSKDEADKLGAKLIELENQLKKEMKSRNKAEKRLKSLMKKLQSLNIFYVSDESETSSFIDKSEISSVSSTTSSFTKQHEEYKEPNTEITKSTKCEIEEPLKKKTESPLLLENTNQFFSSDKSNDSGSNEEDLGSSICGNSSDLEAYQDFGDSKTDNQSTNSSLEIKRGNDQDHEETIDDSLAIILVDTPTIATSTTDPPITSANVKEVLDNLRNIREQIQNSMERRHMIRVGSR